MSNFLKALGFLLLSAPPAAEAFVVQGHRGSRGTHPESTQAAYFEAFSAGADALELDLRLTRDDVLVIHHNPTLNHHNCRHPETGKRLSLSESESNFVIEDLDWTLLSKIICDLPYEADEKGRNPFPLQADTLRAGVPSHELKVLRFEDLLLHLTDWEIRHNRPFPVSLHIEIKAPKAWLKRQAYLDRTQRAMLEVLSRTHVSVNRPISISAFQESLVESLRVKVGEWMQNLGLGFVKMVEVWAPPLKLYELTPWLARRQARVAAGEGKVTIAWTINTAESLDLILANPPVDGVITDFPRLMVTELKKRGLRQ